MAFLHPGFRPAGRGLSVAAVADRGGLRRIHRRGLDGEQAEAVLSAGSAHGFYLCGDLRRAGIHRRDDRDCAVRDLRAGAGLRAAFAAPDGFGRLLALGITAMVLCQALINFAVVLGMMPTKGIPLPFISYGGSSLLVMLLATGVLLNISQQAAARTSEACGIERT